MSAKAKKLPPLPKLCGSQPQLYLRADGQGVTRGAASGASSSQPAQPALGSGFVGGADAGGGSKGIRARRREKPDTAGAGWGNMRAPEMTAEVKRELLMVRMRGALDPKRFYRTSDMKKAPARPPAPAARARTRPPVARPAPQSEPGSGRWPRNRAQPQARSRPPLPLPAAARRSFQSTFRWGRWSRARERAGRGRPRAASSTRRHPHAPPPARPPADPAPLARCRLFRCSTTASCASEQSRSSERCSRRRWPVSRSGRQERGEGRAGRGGERVQFTIETHSCKLSHIHDLYLNMSFPHASRF